jgi:hypothetical protein
MGLIMGKTYVADGVGVGVQTKCEFTVTIRGESRDGNLRVVDDLVSIGVSDEGGGELEWERTLPAVVMVFVLGSFIVLVALMGVLVLVPPCRSSGLVVGLLSRLTVVLGGRSGEGEGGENS